MIYSYRPKLSVSTQTTFFAYYVTFVDIRIFGENIFARVVRGVSENSLESILYPHNVWKKGYLFMNLFYKS